MRILPAKLPRNSRDDAKKPFLIFISMEIFNGVWRRGKLCLIKMRDLLASQRQFSWKNCLHLKSSKNGGNHDKNINAKDWGEIIKNKH